MKTFGAKVLVGVLLVLALGGVSVFAADTVLELDVATAEQVTNASGLVELVGNGIRVIHSVGDGRWELQELDGSKVILGAPELNQTGLKEHYLYVDIDDAFLVGFAGKATITIEYLDTGFTNSWIQYDSKGAAYKSTDSDELVVRGEATGKWKTYSWVLNDAGFTGRQNEKADFRFYAHPKLTFVPELCDRSIPIRKITITIYG